MSVCLCVCLSVSLCASSDEWQKIVKSDREKIGLSVCVCLSVCVSLCVSVCVSVCLSVCLHVSVLALMSGRR